MGWREWWEPCPGAGRSGIAMPRYGKVGVAIPKGGDSQDSHAQVWGDLV